MNAETIIAIITAGVALITSVVSFTLNISNARKDRVQKVILDNRVRYMYEIREGFANLIGLANPGAIKATKTETEAAKAFYSRLFAGYGKIKTYIKPFFDVDKELVDSLDRLYYYILALINGDENDESVLNEYRDDFKNKYLKYDWAYWLYIQRQQSGNYIDSAEAYDGVYAEFIEKYKDKF